MPGQRDPDLRSSSVSVGGDTLNGTLHGDRVAVLGLGLMGGSLARALRSLDAAPRVVGWSPDVAEAEHAHAAGALDEVATDPEVAAGAADLVVYATPLSAVLELLERHRAIWKEESFVTDLASLKSPVVECVRLLGIEERYVGSHPMAGGEGSGFAASRVDLYRGARVWLTEGTGSPRARRELETFWRALGASPAWIDPGDHDRTMAGVSQLPQLLANALALWLEDAGIGRSQLGPGGLDMTRLAASSPMMWRDLLLHSAPRLRVALRELGVTLEELADLLEAGEVERVVALMQRSRVWAVEEASRLDALPAPERGTLEGPTDA